MRSLVFSIALMTAALSAVNAASLQSRSQNTSDSELRIQLTESCPSSAITDDMVDFDKFFFSGGLVQTFSRYVIGPTVASFFSKVGSNLWDVLMAELKEKQTETTILSAKSQPTHFRMNDTQVPVISFEFSCIWISDGKIFSEPPLSSPHQKLLQAVSTLRLSDFSFYAEFKPKQHESKNCVANEQSVCVQLVPNVVWVAPVANEHAQSPRRVSVAIKFEESDDESDPFWTNVFEWKAPLHGGMLSNQADQRDTQVLIGKHNLNQDVPTEPWQRIKVTAQAFVEEVYKEESILERARSAVGTEDTTKD